MADCFKAAEDKDDGRSESADTESEEEKMGRPGILAAIVAMGAGLLLAGNGIAIENAGKQKVVYHINYDNPKQQPGIQQ